MKIYISGGMTNIPNKNRSAFLNAEWGLVDTGYKTVNPWILDRDDKISKTYEEYIRRDIKALIDCDGIATLSGWKKSKGACLEVYIAKFLKMPVHTVEYWRNKCPTLNKV